MDVDVVPLSVSLSLSVQLSISISISVSISIFKKVEAPCASRVFASFLSPLSSFIYIERERERDFPG